MMEHAAHYSEQRAVRGVVWERGAVPSDGHGNASWARLAS